MDLSVVTWNMGYWMHRGRHSDAWAYLLNSLRPDIAFLQECVPPDDLAGYQVIWHRAYPNGTQPWGTALLVSEGLDVASARLDDVDRWIAGLPADGEKRALPRIVGIDGWIASASVTMPDGKSALVVSLHNPSYELERWRTRDVDLTGIKLERNPDVWLVDILFHFLRPRLAAGERMLIGGDFNYSRALDLPPRGDHGNNEFFDRLNHEGFVSLHRIFRSHDEQTFFDHRKGPHQLDYLYADPWTGNRCRACTVVPYDDVRGLSDHAPVHACLSFAEMAD